MIQFSQAAKPVIAEPGVTAAVILPESPSGLLIKYPLAEVFPICRIALGIVLDR